MLKASENPTLLRLSSENVPPKPCAAADAECSVAELKTAAVPERTVRVTRAAAAAAEDHNGLESNTPSGVIHESIMLPSVESDTAAATGTEEAASAPAAVQESSTKKTDIPAELQLRMSGRLQNKRVQKLLSDEKVLIADDEYFVRCTTSALPSQPQKVVQPKKEHVQSEISGMLCCCSYLRKIKK